MATIEIIDATAENIANHAFCGFSNPSHEGHRRKVDWLKKRFAEGLTFKILRVDGVDAGMIEYVRGEHTWRPVEAPGYLVIQCIMIQKKTYKGRGYGSRLIEACAQDAQRNKLRGVAAVTSHDTWMASPAIFRACGFECVDTAPPSYELLVRQLCKAPSPKFRTDGEKTLRKYASGLTVIWSDQCPCIAKCTDDIVRACKTLRIRPKLVELRTAAQARDVPTPYGVFAIIQDGRVVAEHPVSGTRFLNIMRKLAN
jgi:GNAT superfamily N-acetyltransferase